ncbi:uncharacterized protein LOC126054629 [Helicoverpa armigera]|uniref:uncharacterized protein LOC126054629 n=1 Tax=Helicoverpa armigera TaxID=29058 RepID=UPI003082E6CB
MSEGENLIINIERHPCLWDLNNPDYHNRDVKDLAWEQICKNVFDDWENCLDKTNKCAELKKKWANIRDYYRKEVQRNKNIPSGSAAKKAKTYIYSDLLYFLTPMFCKRDSESNYPKEIDATQNENEDENTHPEIHSMESSPPPPSETNKPVLNQKRKKDIPSQILDILQQRQKATSKISSTDEDDDTNFLLSFRSHMKKMNPQQKIDFQLGMLQLVKKVTIGNEPSSYNDNSSGPESSTHSGQSYNPAPQSCYYNSAPSSTYIPSPSMQRNIYVPQSSPIYLKRPSPLHSQPSYFHSSSQQPINSASASQPKIVIRSITNLASSSSNTVIQQNSTQDYPEISIPENAIEESQGSQFLILQSEDSRKENIEKYLKFNNIK